MHTPTSCPPACLPFCLYRQVIIIVGETGSGKTTQIPQVCGCARGGVWGGWELAGLEAGSLGGGWARAGSRLPALAKHGALRLPFGGLTSMCRIYCPYRTMQYLYEAGYGKLGRIGCTQPRWAAG